MALPEKLYTLRKKSGLSQEQLAEALNVSRQAISKWEGGSATPESDKLLALSNYLSLIHILLYLRRSPRHQPSGLRRTGRARQQRR